MFDVLILGGGVSGVSCALVLGSARNKKYAQNKKIAIITHQKTLHYKMQFSTTPMEFQLENLDLNYLKKAPTI